MKTNTKIKKAPATKSVTKAKTSTKTSPKAVKPQAKVVSKVAAAKKTVAKKAAPKVTAKAAVAKKAVKPAAKPVKAAVKKAAPAKAPVKTAAKPAVKKAVVAAKAAPKKVAPKAVVKAEKAPAKTSVKMSAKSVAPKKEVSATVVAIKKPAEKPVVAAVTTAKPIVIKMPTMQNNAPLVARPMPVVATAPAPASANSATARPVYRPIQVINKPLTPVQPVRAMAPVSTSDEKVEFKKGDYVVYPAHGVGEIEAVETQTIGGMQIKLYAIAFEKDRMRLKVPVFKAHASGLRRLSSANRMQDALKTLQGRAQVRRAMWSRRAQEYETKINSGDPVSIAEVLRDLRRSNDDTDQSYSERQIYQAALERLAREVAALEKITEVEAAERLENMIKSKRARAASGAVVAEAANA